MPEHILLKIFIRYDRWRMSYIGFFTSSIFLDLGKENNCFELELLRGEWKICSQVDTVTDIGKISYK